MLRKLFKTGNSIVVPCRRGHNRAARCFRRCRCFRGTRPRKSANHHPPVRHPIAGDVDDDFARQLAEFIEEYRPALEALSR